MRSYRELPMLLYHFQTKGRDEARPRAGVLRTREFIMKDAYSFDRDEAGLEASYEKFIQAYDAIFDRAGLEWYRVESDVGMMGGSGAHEYMAPCPAGENDVALAPGYAANTEVASAEAQPVAPMDLSGELHTPGRDDDRRRGRTSSASSPGTSSRPIRSSPSRAAWSWPSCAATTGSTTSSSRTRCGESFRPAQPDELPRTRRLPRSDARRPDAAATRRSCPARPT